MLSRLRELDRAARALEKRLSTLKWREEVRAYLFLSEWAFWRGMLVLIALFFGVIAYGAVASLSVQGIDYPAPVNAFRFSMLMILACMFVWFIGREKARYYRAKGYSAECLRYSKLVREYRRLDKASRAFFIAGYQTFFVLTLLAISLIAIYFIDARGFSDYVIGALLSGSVMIFWYFFYRRAERYLGDVEVRSVVFSNSAYGLLGGDNAARMSTAGAIILASGLVIAALMRMLGIPLWQFFVVVGAGIVLLIAIVFLNGGVLSWFLGRCRRKRREEKITWSSRDGGIL